MFQFADLPPSRLWIQRGVTRVYRAGLPHSEIHESKLADSSSWLIAANHVLHRPAVPRHPPCALCSFDVRHIRDSSASVQLLRCHTRSRNSRAELASRLPVAPSFEPGIPSCRVGSGRSEHIGLAHRQATCLLDVPHRLVEQLTAIPQAPEPDRCPSIARPPPGCQELPLRDGWPTTGAPSGAPSGATLIITRRASSDKRNCPTPVKAVAAFGARVSLGGSRCGPRLWQTCVRREDG